MVDLLASTDEVKDFETEWKINDGTPITVCCTKEHCAQLGAAAYFEKPVDFDALLALIVAKSNWYFHIANSASDVLLALERGSFDTVISDLRMPVMGGMELLARLRQKYKYMAFVIVTGLDDVELAVEASSAALTITCLSRRPTRPSLQASNDLSTIVSFAEELTYHRAHLKAWLKRGLPVLCG